MAFVEVHDDPEILHGLLILKLHLTTWPQLQVCACYISKLGTPDTPIGDLVSKANTAETKNDISKVVDRRVGCTRQTVQLLVCGTSNKFVPQPS
jgi:hypothetical protein